MSFLLSVITDAAPRRVMRKPASSALQSKRGARGSDNQRVLWAAGTVGGAEMAGDSPSQKEMARTFRGPEGGGQNQNRPGQVIAARREPGEGTPVHPQGERRITGNQQLDESSETRHRATQSTPASPGKSVPITDQGGGAETARKRPRSHSEISARQPLPERKEADNDHVTAQKVQSVTYSGLSPVPVTLDSAEPSLQPNSYGQRQDRLEHPVMVDSAAEQRKLSSPQPATGVEENEISPQPGSPSTSPRDRGTAVFPQVTRHDEPEGNPPSLSAEVRAPEGVGEAHFDQGEIQSHAQVSGASQPGGGEKKEEVHHGSSELVEKVVPACEVTACGVGENEGHGGMDRPPLLWTEPQPRETNDVQIGQVEVIIEAPPPPEGKAPSAPTVEFSSRHFLRRL